MEAGSHSNPRRTAALRAPTPIYAGDIGVIAESFPGDAQDGTLATNSQFPFAVPAPSAPPRPARVKDPDSGYLASQFFPTMCTSDSPDGKTVDLRPLSDVGDAKMVLDELKSLLLRYYQSVYVGDASESIASRLESLQDPQSRLRVSSANYMSADAADSVAAVGAAAQHAIQYYKSAPDGELPGSVGRETTAGRNALVSRKMEKITSAEDPVMRQKGSQGARAANLPVATQRRRSSSGSIGGSINDSISSRRDSTDGQHLLDSTLAEIREKSLSMAEQLEKVDSRLFKITHDPNSRYFAYRLAPQVRRRPKFGSNHEMANAILQLYIDLHDQVAFNERRIRAMRQRVQVLQLAARNQSMCNDTRNAS